MDVKPEEDAEQIRKGFDNQLGVSGWQVPGREPVYDVPEVDPRAPLWWQGDEEASSSFLAAYGITLTDGPLPGEESASG